MKDKIGQDIIIGDFACFSSLTGEMEIGEITEIIGQTVTLDVSILRFVRKNMELKSKINTQIIKISRKRVLPMIVKFKLKKKLTF